MIKHVEKQYTRFLQKGNPVIFPDNFRVYPGSIYGRYTDTKGNRIFWVCDQYNLVEGKLPVHIYNGYWKTLLVSSDHPCYKWVKKVVESLGRIPEVTMENLTFKDCKSMMKSPCLHKKGTGSRLNTYQINAPLKWNEVTEIAHWNGKGNASVVASSIN